MSFLILVLISFFLEQIMQFSTDSRPVIDVTSSSWCNMSVVTDLQECQYELSSTFDHFPLFENIFLAKQHQMCFSVDFFSL